MDLILLADSLDNLQPFLTAVAAAQHRVVKLVGANDEANSYVESLSPDALIILSDEIDRVILREMRAVMAKKPVPIVVMTRDSSEASIDAAVKAGASAYVIDCFETNRIGSLLLVAQTRFNERQRLCQELGDTKNALHERRQIEKAKGIIMKQKSMSEELAYNSLRKLAMDHNKRIGEIAGQIISAAEVLI